MNEITYKHWQVNIDANNIAWLTLRYAEGTTNVLAYAVMQELQILLTQFAAQLPRGLVIMSGYENGFIAGADINEFLTLKTSAQAFERLRFGQQVFAQLAALSCPTIALINGFCMGGGLELALACRYRLALDDNKTRLGAPEILLGIHPGWGGCVRLPLLIGAPAALDLILTGRAVSAKNAKRLGLVDALVPKREFLRAAEYYVMHQPPAHKLRGWRALTNAPLIRPLLGLYMHHQLTQKVNPEHYPAPYAVLKWWESVGPHAEDAFVKEAESVSELVNKPTTENLIRVFFLQERLKKATISSDNARPKHVHVVGSGTMGGDIAVWCALQGFHVTVFDQQLSMLANTRKRAFALFSKKLASKTDQLQALDRLVLDTQGMGLAQADIIIEAIPEQLELKRQVWEVIEKTAKPTALLATNTSSIPLTDIAQHLQEPQRLIGIHFFNPVALMQLVEVVSAPTTDTQLPGRAFQFLKMINHFPLAVRSSPGFLVNRILTPYLLEAAALLDEGVAGHTIDQAAKAFGMPMGPIEIADAVGLDVCLAVAEHLAAHYNWDVPAILRTRVAQKKLGKKTGSGFYEYKNGHMSSKGHDTKNTSATMEQSLITDRMIMRLLNESCACLREKIVIDSDLVDAGMIFGAGFAPFRGGPLHYAQSLGKEVVIQKLTALQERYGDRFKPDIGWQQLD